MTEGRDALLHRARALREAGDPRAALAVLARLEAQHPDFSRLHQERGQCHVQLGEATHALHALTRAVTLNPTLPASWELLARLHHHAGNTAGAEQAARRLAMLRQLPAPLVAANSLHADGDSVQAEQALRRYLPGDPHNVGALRLLARIRMESGAFAEAEALLETVLGHAPDYHEARLDYAMALLQQQKHAAARAQAERLRAHDPANRDYARQFAAACVGMGDYEPVIDVYAGLLEGLGDHGAEVAELRLWRAHALKVAGRQAEAIADYRAARAARPGYGLAWFSLANLKTYRFDDAELAAMQAAAGQAGDTMDRIYFAFALGKALEDRADYAESWRWYERGNAKRSAIARYRPEAATACVERISRVCTHDFFAERTGWGVAEADPVFIVGLPRSGSTLIEQILASHPLVEGTQELTEIGRIAAELCGTDPAGGLPLRIEALAALTADQARGLGERFLAETRVYRRLGRPFFLDKMPNNFWHIGMIHLILPHATILDVRREPMACCFSNLKQLFGTTNQEFAYGIDAIAGYYRAYLALMRHWGAVLPGRVLRVPYEAVVEDLEGSVARMLDHARLPFDSACLAFHQTARSIRTPSSEQVRRPIDRAGIDQWRRYAPWLEPLRTALGDALTEYRN